LRASLEKGDQKGVLRLLNGGEPKSNKKLPKKAQHESKDDESSRELDETLSVRGSARPSEATLYHTSKQTFVARLARDKFI